MSKCEEKKVKPTNTIARDVDYIPHMGDDSNGDYREIDTSVEVSKKQQRPQFVAPLSMNKVANLAKKHRLIAPKVSEKFPLGSTATIDIFTQNEAKRTGITCGAKRQLAFLDVDDETSQDVNGANNEQDGLIDDEYEGDVMRSKDDVDEDDEIEDRDTMTFPNVHQMDDGNSSLFGNITQQVDEDVIGATHSDSEPVGRIRKRVRGPTYMPKIWKQSEGERISVSFNEFGQPVDKRTSSKLSHFIGSIARSGKYCPVNKPWNKVDKAKKQKLLKVLDEKFDLPPGSEDWILQSFGKKVRNWRARIKKEGYDPSLSRRENLNSKPARVNEKQWKRLVKFWRKKESKTVSHRNKKNREKKKMIQVTGKKSYARVREELKESLKGREPTRMELFSACFARDGIAKNVEATNAIQEMQELSSQLPVGSTDEPGPEDIFSKVMGKDQNGAARMYGQGVRASDVWGVIPSHSACRRENLHWKSAYEELSARLAHVESNEKKRKLSENACNGSSRPLSSAQDSTLPKETPPLRVGVSVYLKSIINPTENVAKGWIKSLDPNELVGGEEIGPNWCEVNIQVVLKREERLVRPYGFFITIEDAIGATVAWPCTFISVAYDEA